MKQGLKDTTISCRIDNTLKKIAEAKLGNEGTALSDFIRDYVLSYIETEVFIMNKLKQARILKVVGNWLVDNDNAIYKILHEQLEWFGPDTLIYITFSEEGVEFRPVEEAEQNILFVEFLTTYYELKWNEFLARTEIGSYHKLIEEYLK